MALRLGDTAPDFTAESSEGTINFHEWLGDSWGVLFSHPADFTPVCTTELGLTAKLKDEFAKRNVKVIALSVDPVESHKRLDRGHQRHAEDARQLSDHRRCGPQGVDALRHDPPERERDADGALGVRHRSGKKIRLMITYPAIDGPQLRRDTARHRLAAADRVPQRRDAGQLEGGRRRRDRAVAAGPRGDQAEVPEGLQGAAAVSAHDAAAQPLKRGHDAADGIPADSARSHTASHERRAAFKRGAFFLNGTGACGATASSLRGHRHAGARRRASGDRPGASGLYARAARRSPDAPSPPDAARARRCARRA